jgi:hypothetical protein
MYPDKQRGYFHYFVHDLTEVLGFAIDVIGQHGRRADIPLLQTHCDHADLAEHAISAIKVLEGSVDI